MATNNGFTNWPTELVVMNIMNDGGLYRELVQAKTGPIWQNCRDAFDAYRKRNPADFEECGPGFFASVNWREVAHEIRTKRTEIGIPL